MGFGFESKIRLLALCLYISLMPMVACGDVETAGNKAQSIVIESDFPGGAAVLDGIDDVKVVKISIPSTLETGWRIWWYFQLKGLEGGEVIKLQVDEGQPPTYAKQAVWSYDGVQWQFMPEDYSLEIDGKQVWFAWAVPYVLSDACSLIERAERGCEEAKGFVLAKTYKGNSVPGLRVAQEGVSDKDRPVIWIQARQHAWEVGGSWVADGFVNWLVSEDIAAKALRQKYVIYVVPIMDVDSVQSGFGGKRQKPHDHNRDWVETYWPAVKAVQEKLLEIRENGKLAVFLDLHDPGWKGGHVDFYWSYVGELTERQRATVDRFGKVAKGFFKTYPCRITDRGDHRGESSKKASAWVIRNFSENVLSLTPEIPVAPPKGYKGRPPEHHQAVGAEIGRAIKEYLRFHEVTIDDGEANGCHQK